MNCLSHLASRNGKNNLSQPYSESNRTKHAKNTVHLLWARIYPVQHLEKISSRCKLYFYNICQYIQITSVFPTAFSSICGVS